MLCLSAFTDANATLTPIWLLDLDSLNTLNTSILLFIFSYSSLSHLTSSTHTANPMTLVAKATCQSDPEWQLYWGCHCLQLSPMTTKCLIRVRDAPEIRTTVDSITEPLSALCSLSLAVTDKLCQNINQIENNNNCFNLKMCYISVFDPAWAGSSGKWLHVNAAFRGCQRMCDINSSNCLRCLSGSGVFLWALSQSAGSAGHFWQRRNKIWDHMHR